MAMLTWTQIPGAQGAREFSTLNAATASSDQAVQAAIVTAINTAVASGLYTCTASMSGKAQADIQYWMGLLSGLGYTVSYSGTTLTLTW